MSGTYCVFFFFGAGTDDSNKSEAAISAVCDGLVRRFPEGKGC